MSLDLLQLQSLLLLLQSRLESELELWIQYSYLVEDSETVTELEMAQAKRKLLYSQLGLVMQSLSQLETDLDQA